MTSHLHTHSGNYGVEIQTVECESENIERTLRTGATKIQRLIDTCVGNWQDLVHYQWQALSSRAVLQGHCNSL